MTAPWGGSPRPRRMPAPAAGGNDAPATRGGMPPGHGLIGPRGGPEDLIVRCHCGWDGCFPGPAEALAQFERHIRSVLQASPRPAT